jgi:hypothetical protein
MPSDKLIKEMQNLYKKKGGKNMSRDEAIEACNNLTNFFELLIEIDNREKITKFAKQNDILNTST